MNERVEAIVAVVTVLVASWSVYDLGRDRAQPLVIYTTPALRQVLEEDILPRFEAATGTSVLPVYVAAGEQYNRLKMSGGRPEADLFLHASPLFLEKGYTEGYFSAFEPNLSLNTSSLLASRPVEGGFVWHGFAWSLLVEVYHPRLASPPDLATAELRAGLSHPRLSNNGIYNVAFFETVSPSAGRHLMEQVTVQPTNARANLQGVADGSFDVALGYESVVEFFRTQGAEISSDALVVRGQRYTMPVVFSVGLVKGQEHPEAMALLGFLFEEETQAHLEDFHLRRLPDSGPDAPLPDVPPGAQLVDYDWQRWAHLEALLPTFEVRA